MSNIYNSTLGSTIYDNNYTNHVNDLKDKYYKEQKSKAINPIQNNIITPYSRTLFSEQIMGPVVQDIKYDVDRFDSQFELAKFDKRDVPKSYNEEIANDRSNRNSYGSSKNNINPLTDSQWTEFKSDSTDMTYGVVDKKDFLFETMVPFTARRETIISNLDNSNSSLYLSNFTGVGLKPKKHEVEAFFEPKDSKKETLFINYNSDDMRARYMSANSIKQNGQRPFEPEQVGPGLGLDKSIQNLGGLRDDTRILYKTSNELRNKLNPQISYTAPVKPGRLGDAGTTAQAYGDVNKYRPEKFTEWSQDTIWAGRAASNSQQAPLPHILKDTTRIKSMELYGPSNFGVSQFSSNAYGEFNDPFRMELGEVPIVSSGSAIKSVAQGKDSYQMPELQRDTTNVQLNTFANPVQRDVITKFGDLAKGTVRQETNKPYNTFANPIQQSVTSTYTDMAKGTIRQDTSQQLNTFASPAQQSVTSTYTDLAKSTVRQDTSQQLNTFTSPAQQSTVVSYSDLAKGTLRQETDKPFNTFSAPAQQSVVVSLSDLAKGTIRQETNKPLNTFSAPAQQSGVVSFSDLAKGTIRQETDKPFNTFSAPAQRSNTVALSDQAKATIKQDTLLEDYISSGGSNNLLKLTTYLQDLAKGTIKQDTLLENYVPTVGNSSTLNITTYLQDQAKGTTKQDTLIENYLPTPAQNIISNTATRSNYENIQSSDGRETISKSRVPTWKGFAETPSINHINMQLKNPATHEAYLNPNMSNELMRSDFMQSTKKNDVQQVKEIFDSDFINIMGNYMTQNSLVNNLVHKGKYSAEQVNTFNFNKS